MSGILGHDRSGLGLVTLEAKFQRSPSRSWSLVFGFGFDLSETEAKMEACMTTIVILSAL